MGRSIFGIVALLWISLLVPAGGDPGLCLPSPVSVVCPTCPVLLRCYTVDDWMDFFLPGWRGGL